MRLASLVIALTVVVGCEQQSDSSSNAVQAPPEKEQTVASNLSVWPKIDNGIAINETHETKIDQWLAVMPIEHKVAQMVQGELRHVTPEHVQKYRLGSVLNGGGSYPNQTRESTVADWLALADAYYQASMAPGLDYPAIPLIWGTDAVHGHNNVQGAILFPHNIGLGAANNPSLLRKIGEATGQQVAATGIDWTFAPTVANAIDARWGRTYESYGNNTALISEYSAEIVKGLQGEVGSTLFSDGHLVSTVKHFLGDGGTTRGVDQGDTALDEETLFKLHGQGYVGGLNAGAQTVMASFNSFNGEKIHGSHYLLTTVLKEQMGFDGFVVGDWNGHGQIEGCSNDHCAQAINAGVDMIMVPDDWEAYLLNTIEDVKQGIISEARVDDAVRRILRVKLRANMFERGKPSSRKYAGDTSLLSGESMRALAKDAVEQSLVLVKNDGVLPLNAQQKVYLAGNAVNDIQRQMGGWSVTWQGTETGPADYVGATSIADAIGQNVQLVNSPDDADVIVMLFGEPPYAEFMGDRTHLIYSEHDAASLKLLTTLAETGKPVVSVFLSGRPMWVNPEINRSNAFVAAWLPGYAGEGVADVLFSKDDKDFVGVMPMPWSLGDEQIALGATGSYKSGALVTAQLSEQMPAAELQQDVVLLGVAMIADTAWAVEGDATVKAVDHRVQEDAKQVTFGSDGGQLSLNVSSGVLNLSSWRIPNAVLGFNIRVDAIEADTMLELVQTNQLGTYAVDLTAFANQTEAGKWQRVNVALECLSPDAGSLSAIVMPFAVTSTGQADLAVSDIRVSTSEQSDAQCGATWAGEGYVKGVVQQ